MLYQLLFQKLYSESGQNILIFYTYAKTIKELCHVHFYKFVLEGDSFGYWNTTCCIVLICNNLIYSFVRSFSQNPFALSRKYKQITNNNQFTIAVNTVPKDNMA